LYEHEDVQICQLPNGIRVLTDRMMGVESVALGVWADAGSADEAPDEWGAAHFLEHMLFKGTTTRSAYDLAEAIENVGGQLNAYTERETTHLYARVLAEHLPVALDLLADMTCRSTFAADEFVREQQVVIEEIRKYEGLPDERVNDLLMEGLWANGGLGHSILGTEESVRALTPATVRTCWERHFSTTRVLVTAAGKLEHEAIVEMVATAFAGLPQTAGVLVGLPAGQQKARMIDTEDDDLVHCCWGGFGFPAHDERNFALAMVDSILGGSTTSRLFQKIREERGLAYDVGAASDGFRETGLLYTQASCSAETFPTVLELLVREVDNLQAHGVTVAEFARAKEQMKSGMALSLEGSVDRMRRLAYHFLTWQTVYPLGYLIDRLNAVTLAEVHDVIATVLTPARWTLAAIGPVEEAQVNAILGPAEIAGA
jgi:predicted Zn-dependent peptidase